MGGNILSIDLFYQFMAHFYLIEYFPGFGGIYIGSHAHTNSSISKKFSSLAIVLPNL